MQPPCGRDRLRGVSSRGAGPARPRPHLPPTPSTGTETAATAERQHLERRHGALQDRLGMSLRPTPKSQVHRWGALGTKDGQRGGGCQGRREPRSCHRSPPDRATTHQPGQQRRPQARRGPASTSLHRPTRGPGAHGGMLLSQTAGKRGSEPSEGRITWPGPPGPP